jgi:quercetin dioxygenase-like cupin family protein
MDQYKVDFRTMPWETPMPGLRLKVHKFGGRQIRLVEYAKDLAPHWCEKGHIGYVLEGTIEVTFENSVAIYNPGDGIFIPTGEEHKHKGKVLTDVVQIIFVEDA